LPISDFLNSKIEGATVPKLAFATRNSKINNVMHMMDVIRIHRIYVVESEENKLPVGVITASDVLALFSSDPMA
jgi:predicted transcriptional regulator